MTERSNARVALRLAALVAAALTAVQIVIWLLICLISVRWTAPWWVWTAFPAAGLFAAQHLADRSPGAGCGSTGADGGEAW